MLLINRLFSNNWSIWFFSLLMIGFVIFLLASSKKINIKLWRVLCFVPLLICVLHFIFFRIKGNFWSTKYFFLWFYISALSCLLLVPFSFFPKLKRIVLPIVAVFSIGANLFTVIKPLVWDSAMRNHSHQSWTQSFISTTKDMEKFYSLKEWKNIDIPALREKFIPVVEEAERTGDEGLFAAAVWAYSFYFYDGHVSANIIGDDAWWRALQLLSGNDYGFTMARLVDGTVVAEWVEDGCPANVAGIQNGTVITSWNGQEINQAIEETDYVYYRNTIPVKSTEEMLKPFMLATKGMYADGQKGIVQDLLRNAKITDDSQRPKAKVSFIDENGNEKEIVLDSLGCGMDRLEHGAILLFWKKFEACPGLKNYETVMLNEDTAYMARYKEQDNVFFDVLSYFTNRAPHVKRKISAELEKCREQGMKKLIIDARENSGGFWAHGVETASLFTNRSFDMAMRGSEVGGKKKMLQTVNVPADGSFSDIEVVLLVDPYCMSAGDSLVKVLSECDNVTVMGLAPSNCSCQETGGLSFLADDICNIVYPVNWLYEMDGRRYIDVDESRQCTLPLDVQIPLTYQFLQKLYEHWEDRDVVLDYAMDFLKE